MDEHEFRNVVAAEWLNVPERYEKHVANVALLVEDEPSEEVRQKEGLAPGETLLGLYHGIPNTERGAHYGEAPTLPDTITLYRLPILDEATELTDDHTGHFKMNVSKVVRETIWHEIGHYFGLDDPAIHEREDEGTNVFES